MSSLAWQAALERVEAEANVEVSRLYLPLMTKPQSRYYAQVGMQGTIFGVSATIDTTNPRIREPHFSYATINLIDPAFRWVEVGWAKEELSGCVPRFFYSTQPGQGTYVQDVMPSVGAAYQYSIQSIGNDTWRVEFMDLDGTVLYGVDVPNPGMSHGVRAMAGGELVSITARNELGGAYLRHLRWRDAHGVWRDWRASGLHFDDGPYLCSWVDGGGSDIWIGGQHALPSTLDSPCP